MPLVTGGAGENASTPAMWVRSSRCHSANCCVEISVTDSQVLMRSSVTPEMGLLAFAPETWNDFLAGVRAGEFDL